MAGYGKARFGSYSVAGHSRVRSGMVSAGQLRSGGVRYGFAEHGTLWFVLSGLGIVWQARYGFVGCGWAMKSEVWCVKVWRGSVRQSWYVQLWMASFVKVSWGCSGCGLLGQLRFGLFWSCEVLHVGARSIRVRLGTLWQCTAVVARQSLFRPVLLMFGWMW